MVSAVFLQRCSNFSVTTRALQFTAGCGLPLALNFISPGLLQKKVRNEPSPTPMEDCFLTGRGKSELILATGQRMDISFVQVIGMTEVWRSVQDHLIETRIDDPNFQTISFFSGKNWLFHCNHGIQVYPVSSSCEKLDCFTQTAVCFPSNRQNNG